MIPEIQSPLWEHLQALAPRVVVEFLIAEHFWTIADGPTDRFALLTDQLRPYFGFYPDSETLRAEFQAQFAGLNQAEQDSLFRLVKSLHLGRWSLYSDE